MRNFSLMLLIGLMSACARAEASRQPVQVEMKNVDLHVASDISLHVRHLRGHFAPAKGHQIPYLDDTTSYAVVVQAGEVAVDLASLNALMTRTFGQDRSNVDKLRVSIEPDGVLRQKGVIDSAINIPFNAKSTVSVTPDGRLRITTKSVRGFGVPIKPLMKLFSVEMDDMLKIQPGNGVTVDGNDLILDTGALLPAPKIRGRLTAARIEGQTLVQTFGSRPSRSLLPSPSARNYIYWRGGQLSFGKLTMTDTDLELVDRDPDDAFDFSSTDWDRQLVAGYSRTMPNRGLKAFMPDYNDLGTKPRVAARR
jgi:hypothetical protein